MVTTYWAHLLDFIPLFSINITSFHCLSVVTLLPFLCHLTPANTWPRWSSIIYLVMVTLILFFLPQRRNISCLVIFENVIFLICLLQLSLLTTFATLLLIYIAVKAFTTFQHHLLKHLQRFNTTFYDRLSAYGFLLVLLP